MVLRHPSVRQKTIDENYGLHPPERGAILQSEAYCLQTRGLEVLTVGEHNTNLLVVPVLHRILLEGLVCDALEVVHKRLIKRSSSQTLLSDDYLRTCNGA